MGIENLTGSRLDDALSGCARDNEIEGSGGDGNLAGSPGADALVGGGGREVMRGGVGDDVFVYRSAAETGGTEGSRCDRVAGFVSGQDRCRPWMPT